MHDGNYDAATLLYMAPGIITEHNDINMINVVRLKNDEFIPAEIIFPNKEAFRRYTESLKTRSNSPLYRAKVCDSVDDYNASNKLINAMKMDSNMEGEKKHDEMLIDTKIMTSVIFESIYEAMTSYREVNGIVMDNVRRKKDNYMSTPGNELQWNVPINVKPIKGTQWDEPEETIKQKNQKVPKDSVTDPEVLKNQLLLMQQIFLISYRGFHRNKDLIA